MTKSLRWTMLALAAAIALPASAQAHRAWLLPSATVLSGDDLWVTVDAAISNDLFYFEHHPMRLNGLKIIGPDGAAVEPENASTGRYRSTFDVKLASPGTYKMAVVNESLFASYEVNGERKRARGSAAELKGKIPEDATKVRITQSQNRLEIFVTAGKPSTSVLKPTNSGLELMPVTHPNDLVAGEPAKFQLLLDGKPAGGVEVSIIPGGIRYRDQLNETKVKTGEDGGFTMTAAEPGMYWLNAEVRDDKASMKDATRRASYSATLEVMPK